MKRKSGNIYFAVFAQIFGCVNIALAIVCYHYSDIVMFYIFLVFGVVAFGFGTINLVYWIWDYRARKNGQSQTAEIVKLSGQIPDKTNLYSDGNTYYIEYEYKINDKAYVSGASVTKDIYDGLSIGSKIPVLVYKHRAVIDYSLIRKNQPN